MNDSTRRLQREILNGLAGRRAMTRWQRLRLNGRATLGHLRRRQWNRVGFPLGGIRRALLDSVCPRRCLRSLRKRQ